MSHNRALVLIAILIAIAGCRTQRLRHDQDAMRHAVTNMYTNQVMDNLVLAYRGYPFVQIDYTSFAGTVTDARGLAVSGTIPEHGIDILGIGGDASSNQQLAITGLPVTNDNDVYLRYIEFAQDPELFISTTQPPPSGAAHIAKVCDGVYYWVPCDKAQEFRNLALRVSVMRGGPSTEVNDYYTTRVVGVVPTDDYLQLKNQESAPDVPPSPIAYFDLLVQIDDDLPQDTGTATFVVGGVVMNWIVERVEDNQREEAQMLLSESELHLLRITFSNDDNLPLTISAIEESLASQIINVRLAHFRPSAPTTPEDKLDALTREVQLFRLNQQAGF